MSALSNVFLGEVPNRWFIVDRRGMEKRFRELAQWMGVNISPHVKANTLSVANQQMLEIMRAVHAEHDVIIMDEPTAPLGPFERSRLYDLIRRLKENNASIIFISHDLDEVLRLCDRVSVMRDGQLIETRRSAAWTKDTLVKSMLGDVQIVRGRKRERENVKPLLRVHNLSLPGKVTGISFELGEGDVLGIAGLVGAGRTEVLRSIAGLEPLADGRMTIDGQELPWPSSVRDAIRHGIALAPEDRKREGLVLSRSALCNLLLADIGSVSKGPVISAGARRAAAALLARKIGFNPDRLDSDALHLSGGNQQKLVIGKWLYRRPRILLLDEPTRGIDLGAKQEIFQTIRGLSDQGLGVILVSSDLEEVVEHADRVLVMARGKPIATLDSHEASVERILNLIFAVENRPLTAGVN
jgi:ABC-type sugar transport system ATPase subunit